MQLDLSDYDLPPHLIAQHPAPERDRSRLLVLRRGGPVVGHRVFADLPELLAPGDLLVLNDTRVVPAGLLGRRAGTGGRWEGLFLHETPDGLWELLSQTRGHLIAGETVLGAAPPAPRPPLELVSKTPARHCLARPEGDGSTADLRAPSRPSQHRARCGPGVANRTSRSGPVFRSG